MPFEIGGIGRGIGEAVGETGTAERAGNTIGVRENPDFGTQLRQAAEPAGGEQAQELLRPQVRQQDADRNEDAASIYEDAVSEPVAEPVRGGAAETAGTVSADQRLSDDEVSNVQSQIDALRQARTGRSIETGDDTRDAEITRAIANDPVVALHQKSLDFAVSKMEQAVTSRNPEAVELAAKDALQSAKDLDGLRNEHERSAMTRASLGMSGQSLGEAKHQNKFSRANMWTMGAVGVTGLAVAGTVGGIAANKNING